MFMNKPFILVVEDDKPIRKLITTTLETQGYKYHTAETGEASILEAVSKQPDLMILVGVAGYGWCRYHKKVSCMVEYAYYCGQRTQRRSG